MPSLPKKMIDRIISGQYVDFSEFPPARGRVCSLPTTEEGHIGVVRAEDLLGTRKLIPDLATWLQCFCIYMAVVTEHEPDRVKPLLAYLSMIDKASAKFSWLSWVVYDQNFRQETADSGRKYWSKVDSSIYTQSFTNASLSGESWCRICQSIDYRSSACPLRSRSSSNMANTANPLKRQLDSVQSTMKKPRPAPHSVPQPCKWYNQCNGDCRFGEQCIYMHQCETCAKPSHAGTQCPEQKKVTGRN